MREVIELDAQTILGNGNKEPWPNEERRFEVTEVYTESDAAFSMAVNKQASAEMKHIPLNFVKNCITCGEFVSPSVSSKQNIADILMKILCFSTMKHLCSLIGLS